MDPLVAIPLLEMALSQGRLTIEYDGFRTTYRSVDDLLKALAYFKAKAAENAGAGTANAATARATYTEFTRD